MDKLILQMAYELSKGKLYALHSDVNKNMTNIGDHSGRYSIVDQENGAEIGMVDCIITNGNTRSSDCHNHVHQKADDVNEADRMDDKSHNLDDGSDGNLSDNDANNESDEESKSDSNLLVSTYVNPNDVFTLKWERIALSDIFLH